MKINKKVAKKLILLEEKRVVILKDAVAQIKLEALIPVSGNGYVQNWELDENINSLCYMADIVAPKGKKTELQFYIDKLINKTNPCDVCAKGALLISSIRRYNNVSLQNLEECNLDSLASNRIKDIFGVVNANLMENYFENGDPNFDIHEDEDIDTDPWMDLNDTDRILKIFNNAIRNKGIFKPEQEKF